MLITLNIGYERRRLSQILILQVISRRASERIVTSQGILAVHSFRDVNCLSSLSRVSKT